MTSVLHYEAVFFKWNVVDVIKGKFSFYKFNRRWEIKLYRVSKNLFQNNVYHLYIKWSNLPKLKILVLVDDEIKKNSSEDYKYLYNFTVSMTDKKIVCILMMEVPEPPSQTLKISGFTDFELCFNKTTYQVHKFLLAAHWPHFYPVLHFGKFGGKFPMQSAERKDVEDFIDYIYNRKDKVKFCDVSLEPWTSRGCDGFQLTWDIKLNFRPGEERTTTVEALGRHWTFNLHHVDINFCNYDLTVTCSTTEDIWLSLESTNSKRQFFSMTAKEFKVRAFPILQEMETIKCFIFTKRSSLIDYSCIRNEWTDFTYIFKNSHINVHRALLAARSPVLLKQFQENPEITELYEYPPFEKLINYCYTGRVYSAELLVLAKQYKMKDLQKMCEFYVTKK